MKSAPQPAPARIAPAPARMMILLAPTTPARDAASTSADSDRVRSMPVSSLDWPNANAVRAAQTSPVAAIRRLAKLRIAPSAAPAVRSTRRARSRGPGPQTAGQVHITGIITCHQGRGIVPPRPAAVNPETRPRDSRARRSRPTRSSSSMRRPPPPHPAGARPDSATVPDGVVPPAPGTGEPPSTARPPIAADGPRRRVGFVHRGPKW